MVFRRIRKCLFWTWGIISLKDIGKEEEIQASQIYEIIIGLGQL